MTSRFTTCPKCGKTVATIFLVRHQHYRCLAVGGTPPARRRRIQRAFGSPKTGMWPSRQHYPHVPVRQWTWPIGTIHTARVL